MNSKILLIALLACGALNMTMFSTNTVENLEVENLQVQTIYFNFWAGSYYCNAKSGSSYGSTNFMTYSYTSSSMIDSLSSDVRQMSALAVY